MNRPFAFQAGQPARTAHSSLKSAIKAMDQAKNCAVLWFGDIYDRQLFKDLGYGSITAYARNELGFSPARTSDFLNICRRLKQLPKVANEVRNGKLGYTKAREVVKVAGPETQDQWLDAARGTTRDDLALKVKQAKRQLLDRSRGQGSLLPPTKPVPVASPPARISLVMSAWQLTRYEALWEKIRKNRNVATDQVEALLEILEHFAASDFTGGNVEDLQDVENKIDGKTPPASGEVEAAIIRPPVQVHIHQCPDCGKTSVQTGKGELVLSPSEAERARCDAMISQPGKRNTAGIAPKIRRQVLERDRHRCQGPGCRHNRFLEVHHIVPRSRGGSNAAENLVTLCSGCHGAIHRSQVSGPNAGESNVREPMMNYGRPVASGMRSRGRITPAR